MLSWAAKDESEYVDEVEYEEDEEEELDRPDIGQAWDYQDSKNGVLHGAFALNSRRPNAHGGFHCLPNSSSLQPRSNRTKAFPLEDWEGRINVGMSNSVTTAIRGNIRDMAIGKKSKKDKADRATVQKVLDKRILAFIDKMQKEDITDNTYGCISTGKEANVYYATQSEGPDLAIKVYRTSNMVFKNRIRYMEGDHRFESGYNKHNPRQMVKIWAEKEFRNLMRLQKAGIRCPSPLLVKLRVLVMEFIGKGGDAAPRLKDAGLSLDKLRESYFEIILAMRTMYRKCKLVHADLSEYNILYHEGHLYIIDVSQSVELDHPLALYFLREDIVHVSDFFKKNGVAVMSVRELFVFIIDASIDDDSVDSYLEEVQQKILARGDLMSAEEEIADALFMQAYIPITLNQVINVEEYVFGISGNYTDTEDMYHQTITGMLAGKQPSGNHVTEEEHECGSSGTEDDDFSSKLDMMTTSQRQEMRKAARKENKKRVKEEKREARQTKPKALKKIQKKAAKARKTSNSSVLPI